MCKLAEDMHQARKEFASDKQNLMDELVSIIILFYYVMSHDCMWFTNILITMYKLYVVKGLTL